jgi:hypothetical protein
LHLLGLYIDEDYKIGDTDGFLEIDCLFEVFWVALDYGIGVFLTELVDLVEDFT